MSGWGGVRAGQGRKSRAYELGLPRLISRAIPDSENIKLIKKIFEEALAGSFPHAKLYLEYRYGKVPEHLTIENGEVDEIKLSKLDGKELILLDGITNKIEEEDNSSTEREEGNNANAGGDTGGVMP